MTKSLIIIMGAPGSGKGTMAPKICKQYNCKHISTGDLFRAEKKSGSELGLIFASYQDHGVLIPDDIADDFIFNYIKNCDEQRLLLDGYPRTLDQAKSLLSQNFCKIEKVIVLNADRDTVISRIDNRLICSDCRKSFSSIINKDRICDVCSKPLTKRPDDNIEIAARRFSDYESNTYPVIKFIIDRGIESVELK